MYVFDDESGLWNDTEESFLKIIRRSEQELFLLKLTKYGLTLTNKNYATDTGLVRKMLPQLKSLCIDNEWIERDSNTSLGKLLFNNGILNLRTGIFTEQFDPQILFFNKIQYDYNSYINEEDTE